MNNKLADLKLIALGDLRESETNPRKNFTPGPLAELAESVKTQGIRQPLLVRPKAGSTPYEIVAGARRFRAGGMAKLTAAPCLVSEMSDWEAEEVQAIENLQREDLTEIEEAESYDRMLKLKGEDGVLRYTVPVLAQRFSISESKIYKRLKLLDLPKAGREALEKGTLGARQAVLIGRIPDPAAREEALKLVLAPQHKKEPLTFLETEAMIAEKFMNGLKGVPFKLDDAELLPVAGACSACPKMTDNCKHLFSPEEAANYAKRKVCCDPTCFRAKLDAVWKARTAKAEAEGKIILSEKASREIYPTHTEEGEMTWESSYVEINAKPAANLLKAEVEKVGSWRSMIEEAEEKTGQKVPRILARDQAGTPRELVERKLAITAIESAGDPIFAAKVGSKANAGSSDFEKQRKAELERARVRLAESFEGMTQMHEAFVSRWEPSAMWEALLLPAMVHAGSDGLWLIAKWKGLKLATHGTNKDEVVNKWLSGLLPAERQAIVPLLLIGQAMKYSGIGEAYEQLAKNAGLGIDVKAIERKVRDQMRDEKAVKKAAGKAPKAPKKTKKAQVADEAASYQWNANGVAEKPSKSSILGMPDGTHCEVRMALHADGHYRIGLDLRSRTEGKSGMCYSPSENGKKFKHEDAAAVAACTEALPFFKDDPAAFKVVAAESDEKVAAAIEAEGGVAPVTVAPAAAPVTTDPEMLAQWVKAHAGGLSAEEIARSYGVPLADVEGALELAKPAEAPKPKKLRGGEILAGVKQQVCDMTCAGRTAVEIQKDLGISLASIQNIRKEFGLVKSRPATAEPAAATEPPPAEPAAGEVGAIPAAQDERYVGLPASTHTAIDLINAGKTTHEIAAGAGITLAEVIKLRQQMEHDRAQEKVA